MKLDAVIKPPTDLGGRRFFLISYLPTCAALLFLLMLLLAGARGWMSQPGHRISFKVALATATGLGLGGAVVLVVTVTLLAVLLQPFQLAVVRVLEGAWPVWLGSGLARRWQVRRKRRLSLAAQLPQDDDSALTEQVVQRAGVAGDELRRLFPLPEHLVRATALGNVLAAVEDSAGRAYGLDAVTAWPRLYPVLGEQVRAIVDDRRDALDAAARLAATMAVVAAVSAVLLGWSGGWLLLALLPLPVAMVAYRGAVVAALAYGEAVHAAFDLHHFDLLTALHMDLPSEPDVERSTHEQWCDLWRQGVSLPPTLKYSVDTKEK